jgi:hypothetical protein
MAKAEDVMMWRGSERREGSEMMRGARRWAAWGVAALVLGGGWWGEQGAAGEELKGAGATSEWGVTLKSQQTGGCSRGFYHDNAETRVRLDLSAPLAPTLTLEVQRLYTSGSFEEGRHVSPPPQWAMEVRRFEGALRETQSAGQTQWGFWLVSEQSWRFEGYPSDAQKEGPPHDRSDAQNVDPDLTLTCAHDWLMLEGGERVVAMSCQVEALKGGDIDSPALRWPMAEDAVAQVVYVTQGASQVEGEAEAVYGGGAVMWRRLPTP